MPRILFTGPESATISGGQIASISAPKMGWIKKLKAVANDSPTFNLTFYNRAFTSTPVNIVSYFQSDTPNVSPGTALGLTMASPVAFRAGDTVTISGSGSHDDDYTVLEVISNKAITLNTPYVTSDTGGTIALNIPEEQWPLWEVLTVAGSSSVASYDDADVVPFLNVDPLPKGQSSPTDVRLYFESDEDDTYTITVTYLMP